MTPNHGWKSAIDSLLRRLPQLGLSQDWVTILFDLYRALRQWIIQQRQEGMYEILDYDSTLELVDARGETAIFKRRQRVKYCFRVYFRQEGTLRVRDTKGCWREPLRWRQHRRSR